MLMPVLLLLTHAFEVGACTRTPWHTRMYDGSTSGGCQAAGQQVHTASRVLHQEETLKHG
jgi:hypothetical protein